MVKIALYEPSTRQIYLRDDFQNWPKTTLRRTLIHEATTDTLLRTADILPQQYTPEQQTTIAELLKIGFERKKRPKIGQTRIRKLGYREVLCVGKYAVTDLKEPMLMDLSEIYPTMMEIFTSQILARNGDVLAFDTDVSNGNLQMLPQKTKIGRAHV